MTGEDNWGERNVDYYLASLYWAIMTLTTIGYGDVRATNTIEWFYANIGMLIGSACFAYVVGTMCTVFQNLQAGTLRFQTKMDSINDLMSTCGVPQDLVYRVRKFCLYQRDVNFMGTEEELLSFLSPSLRREVFLFQYRDILRAIDYFSTAPDAFLGQIAENFVTSVFGPRERVITQNDKDDRLFIVSKGHVQYHRTDPQNSSDLKFVGILGKGGVFGETSLLFGSPQAVSVSTLSFVEMHHVHKHYTDLILHRYPRMRATIRSAFIRNKWRILLKDGQIAKALRRGARRHMSMNSLRPGDSAAALGVVPEGSLSGDQSATSSSFFRPMNMKNPPRQFSVASGLASTGGGGSAHSEGSRCRLEECHSVDSTGAAAARGEAATAETAESKRVVFADSSAGGENKETSAAGASAASSSSPSPRLPPIANPQGKNGVDSGSDGGAAALKDAATAFNILTSQLTSLAKVCDDLKAESSGMRNRVEGMEQAHVDIRDKLDAILNKNPQSEV